MSEQTWEQYIYSFRPGTPERQRAFLDWRASEDLLTAPARPTEATLKIINREKEPS